MRSQWRLLVAVVLALGLVAAACGDSAETTTTTAGQQQTTTTQAETTTTTEAMETTTTTVAETTTTTVSEVMPLLVWADENRAPIIQAVAEDFTAATGVPVQVEILGFGDIRDNMIQQGPIGEGADVFIGAHDWIGELAVNGVVEPVDLGARSGEFFPVALDAFSFEGALYGVPYAIEAIALYRNTDLVPDAPESIGELVNECTRLENDGAGLATCLALPAGGDAYHHYPFVGSQGGYIFAYDAASGYDPSDVGIDAQGAVDGMQLLVDLIGDGVVDPAVDYGTMTSLFFEGQAAFMWTGPWELANVQDTDINYAVSKLPTLGGETATPFVGVQGFFVNAFSDQKALAQTFVLDYIATQDVMVDLYNVGLRAPAHIASFDVVADDPDVQAFGASAADGQPMPNIPEMSAVWGALGDAVAAVYGGTSPEEALGTAAESVRNAIAEG